MLDWKKKEEKKTQKKVKKNKRSKKNAIDTEPNAVGLLSMPRGDGRRRRRRYQSLARALCLPSSWSTKIGKRFNDVLIDDF